MVTLKINGRSHELDVPEDMPLLWAIRDIVGLTGTKYGCGMSLCGTCTVHQDGKAIRSCTTPIKDVKDTNITTIEALAEDATGKKVQEAWLDLGVPQCGFCQVGQIMSATALLKSNNKPSDSEIDDAMSGNLCRCGTYNRIRAAIHRVADGKEEQA